MLTEEVHEDEVRVGADHEGLSLGCCQLAAATELVDGLQRSIGVLDGEVVGAPQRTQAVGAVVLGSVVPVG